MFCFGKVADLPTAEMKKYLSRYTSISSRADLTEDVVTSDIHWLSTLNNAIQYST
jgi:hypothetical protein